MKSVYRFGGMPAVECANLEELTAALATIRAAVDAGELDTQIEAASAKLRDGFGK